MSLTVLLSLCLLSVFFDIDSAESRGCYSSSSTTADDEHEMPGSRSNSEQPPSSTMNRSDGSSEEEEKRNDQLMRIKIDEKRLRNDRTDFPTAASDYRSPLIDKSFGILLMIP